MNQDCFGRRLSVFEKRWAAMRIHSLALNKLLSHSIDQSLTTISTNVSSFLRKSSSPLHNTTALLTFVFRHTNASVHRHSVGTSRRLEYGYEKVYAWRWHRCVYMYVGI